MKITGKSVLLFDLDGTLTDPAKGITNSFIHALTLMGKEIPSYETLCSFIGPPLTVTFREKLGFPEEEVADCVRNYRAYYAENGIFENKVYEGIPELLEKLQSAGYRIFMATSKPEPFALRIAEKFGFARYFEGICGSAPDESRGRKAEVIAYALETAGLTDADKEKVLMIGDRFYDVEGAAEMGLDCCGVLFGYGDRKELEDAGAKWIAETVEELKELLI